MRYSAWKNLRCSSLYLFKEKFKVKFEISITGRQSNDMHLPFLTIKDFKMRRKYVILILLNILKKGGIEYDICEDLFGGFGLHSAYSCDLFLFEKTG